MWEAVFIIYPLPTSTSFFEDWSKERAANFEHMLGMNGRPTEYSKWHYDVAIVGWEEGMTREMEWKENMFTKKMWHSKYWLDQRGEMREEKRWAYGGEVLRARKV